MNDWSKAFAISVVWIGSIVTACLIDNSGNAGGIIIVGGTVTLAILLLG